MMQKRKPQQNAENVRSRVVSVKSRVVNGKPGRLNAGIGKSSEEIGKSSEGIGKSSEEINRLRNTTPEFDGKEKIEDDMLGKIVIAEMVDVVDRDIGVDEDMVEAERTLGSGIKAV